MKKVRINKKYGAWFYEKARDYDMEFCVYVVKSEDGKETYTLGNYADMIACIKEPTKELRERYERIYG